MVQDVVPLDLARRMALSLQLLGAETEQPPGKEGVARTIETLGYVQIDTIAVVARAHHHTLWVRRPDYEPTMLHELLVEDRRVFEYWGHAASYLPISDYRYYIPKMIGYREAKTAWAQRRLERAGHLLEPVLERIRAEGPLTSKDFAPEPGAQRGTWWDWKPAKIALELLFWRGELMIAERRNFQRVYDLAERVLPPGTATTVPDQGELGRFLIRRALAAYGVAREREIRDHIRGADRALISRVLAEMENAAIFTGSPLPGEVTRVVFGRDRLRRDKPELIVLYLEINLVGLNPWQFHHDREMII